MLDMMPGEGHMAANDQAPALVGLLLLLQNERSRRDASIGGLCSSNGQPGTEPGAAKIRDPQKIVDFSPLPTHILLKTQWYDYRSLDLVTRIRMVQLRAELDNLIKSYGPKTPEIVDFDSNVRTKLLGARAVMDAWC